MSLCPLHNGTVYSDTNGDPYVIYCNVDFSNSDLPTAPANTFAQCISACDTYVQSELVIGGANCIGVTFNPIDVNGNPCYLKYEIIGNNVNWNASGLESARRLQYAIGSPSVLTTFAPTSVSAVESASKSDGATRATTTTPASSSRSQSAKATRASAATPAPSAVGFMRVGISTGAKIGIGVGVGLCVILIVILIGWCVWTRRRRKPGFTYVQSAPDGPVRRGPAELPGVSARHELQGDKPG